MSTCVHEAQTPTQTLLPRSLLSSSTRVRACPSRVWRQANFKVAFARVVIEGSNKELLPPPLNLLRALILGGHSSLRRHAPHARCRYWLEGRWLFSWLPGASPGIFPHGGYWPLGEHGDNGDSGGGNMSRRGSRSSDGSDEGEKDTVLETKQPEGNKG